MFSRVDTWIRIPICLFSKNCNFMRLLPHIVRARHFFHIFLISHICEFIYARQRINCCQLWELWIILIERKGKKCIINYPFCDLKNVWARYYYMKSKSEDYNQMTTSYRSNWIRIEDGCLLLIHLFIFLSKRVDDRIFINLFSLDPCWEKGYFYL